MVSLSKRKGLTLAAIIALIGLTVFSIVLFQNWRWEDQRLEALEELEARAGEYDEQSIVLYHTSRVKAEQLAEKYGATLRITKSGTFATLTLPEGVTIRDVYADRANRRDVALMSADYQVAVSDLMEGTEGSGSLVTERPRIDYADADYARQVYLDYLNLRDIPYMVTGQGTSVAVIDTGIDTDHPEFAGRISEYSYNASLDKIVKDYTAAGGGYDWSLVEDEQGHGTAVTGVIAGAVNGTGIVGIAPDVEIIVIKAECDQYGRFKRTSDLVFGLFYAIERDVDVVNMSFGSYDSSNPFAEATQLAYDSDVICVAAAGNDTTTMRCWPAADPLVIGVGALDGWYLAEYSNYGENTDLVAPGTTFTSKMGGTYGNMVGTSLASPIVAATVALYSQNNSYYTFEDVTELLYASCRDLGDLGRDWYYGFGAVDVYAFLMEERGTVTYDMLTDELEDLEGLFIRGHALQEIPEPERLYAVFDGWYYDDTFTQPYNYYTDAFYGDLTLYAKWVNEDDGVPYTYVELDDGTIEIRSYTGKRRYITIPEKINGKVVSSIGDFAFAGQRNLREVKLPNGLTHIGNGAFKECANLTSIHIPAGVRSLGDEAFLDATRLSTVAFLGDSKLAVIGDYAFRNCGSLRAIELPATVNSLNGSVFFGASSLRSITVQKGNTAFSSLDGVLFNYAGTTLVAYPAGKGTVYTIPERVEIIGSYAFGYTGLSTVNLANVKAIQNYAFAFSFLETVTIPDGVISLGKSAFEGSAYLRSVTIGRGLAILTEGAFAKTYALNSVIIPNTVLAIEQKVFEKSGLTAVTFETNSTLSVIGADAFFDCSIRKLEIPASVTSIDARAFTGTYAGNPISELTFAAGSRLHTIGNNAFERCYELKNVTLPQGLKTLGELSFSQSGLVAVTVPASVTSLGNGAFAGCFGVNDIFVEDGNTVYYDEDGVVYDRANTTIHAFPSGRSVDNYTVKDGIVTVASYAFAWAQSYVVDLPESLVQISEYGFYSSNLTMLLIPDNVTQIGRYAFAKSWGLTDVRFSPESKLPRLSYGAFAHSGIASLSIPANVSTIAQGVFEGCRQLYEVTFMEGSKLTSLSAYQFNGCDSLQRIQFMPGSHLTSVQAHALEGMRNLMSVDFGDAKVTNIDNFAFRFCERLSGLVLPSTVTDIGRYAFYGCVNLEEITLPASLEHIGSYAFLQTAPISLYFTSETLPLYLDENWDTGAKDYYTGVTNVETRGDFTVAHLSGGNLAIIGYHGSATALDLSQVDLGAPITVIGGGAFRDSHVTSVVLPSTLTAIQAEAFAYSSLTSVTVPASVTFIGRNAFAYTPLETLTFASGSRLAVIEQYAFMGAKKLTAVTLPASLTKMGTGAFMESGLTSVTFAPDIVLEEIPEKAFASTRLTAVVIPDSVSLVNHNAFNGVETLKEVTFGKHAGLRLMSNAFYHTGLTSLHIPANVTYIGEYCFVALPNLKSYSVDAANPNYKAVDGLLLSKNGRKLIAVPAGRTGELTVPVSVEEIGFGAFEESKLTRVYFDASANILSFGYRAFFKAAITEITIPASVVSIDYYAFAYCEDLHTVTFAEGNHLKGIYEGAFCGDINLANIVIPDAIVEISDFAFYGCSKITELPISDTGSLRGIFGYAFAYTGLSGDFVAPDSLIDIGAHAFAGCDFTSITISDANQYDLIIGIGAFEECDNVTEVVLPFIGASLDDEQVNWLGYLFGAGSAEANEVYVPDSLVSVRILPGITTVAPKAFMLLDQLQIVELPDTVTRMGNRAFYQTPASYELKGPVQLVNYDWMNNLVPDEFLEGGTFGQGITGTVSIVDGNFHTVSSVFENCQSLEKVVLPPCITEIPSYFCHGCTSLTEVEFQGEITSIGLNAFARTGLTSFTVPATVTSMDYAVFLYCESLKELILEDGLTAIDNESLGYITGLESIVIPDSVTELGDFAFIGCTSLEKVVLPSGLKKIPQHAFSYCHSLTDIRLPDTVTEIGNNAFDDCRALTEISLPANLKTVGDYAFRACESLTDIRFPDSVTELGEGMLIHCIALTSVKLPNGMTTVPSNFFSGCSSLASIILPASVTAFEPAAFYNSGLKTFTVPEGIKALPDECFSACSSLTSVKLPSTLESIGNSAFNSCYTLTDVTIPDSVTTIGREAFRYCQAMKKIDLPAGLTAIEPGTFSFCIALNRITIPASVQSIGNDAFFDCLSLYYVFNHSDLSLAFGSSEHGYVAENAWIIEDADGTHRFLNSSYCITADDFVYRSLDSGIVLTGYLGDLETVTLPATIEGKSYKIQNFTGAKHVILPAGLTEISSGAFAGNTELESVVLPESVTHIMTDAFYNCTNLKTVNLPSGVTNINTYAFANCASLETLILPSQLTAIEAHAFEGCVKLASLTVPKTVSQIGNNAFDANTTVTVAADNPSYTVVDGILYNAERTQVLYAIDVELETVVLPGTVKEIMGGAFQGCTKLTKVTLPEGMDSIQDNAFSGCISLTTINFPDSITIIGYEAFKNCKSLASIDLPDGLFYLNMGVFQGCESLTSVVIPGGVTTTWGNTFADCTALTSVTLPSGLMSLGSNTFMNCVSLAAIELPAGMTEIGSNVFQGCTALKSLQLPPSLTTVSGGLCMDCTALESVTIPSGVTRIEWSAFAGCRALSVISLPAGVTEIGVNAFGGCASLTEVILPAGLQILGGGAFSDCDGLTSVVIPGTVSLESEGHFSDCDALESVILQSGITTIPARFVMDCEALTTISIPDTVASIGEYAFTYCKSLSSVTIPAGLTHLGEESFMGSGIRSVKIPAGITALDERIFSDCSSLESVTLSEGLVSVGNWAFSNCHRLNTVTFPSSLRTVGEYAFYNCDGMTEVILPAGVTTLMRAAFNNCDGVRRIVVPDSVTEMGSEVFAYCWSLTDISLGKGITAIPDSAFTGLIMLRTFTVPEGITAIGNNAFEDTGLTMVQLPSTLAAIGENAFSECRDLTFVQNGSNLAITPGSSEHGHVAERALAVRDKNGNVSFADGGYRLSSDGFLYRVENGEYLLLEYVGGQDTVTLPLTVDGHPYRMDRLRGIKHLILPDGMTEIPSSAFMNSGTLESVFIPSSVKIIGSFAFENCLKLKTVTMSEGVEEIYHYAFQRCPALSTIHLPASLRYIGQGVFNETAVLDNPAYSRDGLVVVDDWLLDVDESLTHLPRFRDIRGVASDAYENCHLLKEILWCYGIIPSNVETIYLSHIAPSDSYRPEMSLTVKQFVILESFTYQDFLANSYFFGQVSDMLIFVEGLDNDLRLDANYPGWQGDNKVVYSDRWTWSIFYDEDGEILRREPRLNTSIIRLPILRIPSDSEHHYKVIGWDLDGDGVADSIPASSVVDMMAEPVIATTARSYIVSFVDAATGTVYHTATLPYGATVTLPQDPTKTGYAFQSWKGYSAGMTVRGDTVIEAVWKHVGAGHSYQAPIWVDATCTAPGHYRHVCSVCGEFYATGETVALGHHYQMTVVKPGCESEGYDLYDCSRCDASYRENVKAATGHHYGDWIVDEEPQCTATGKRHRDCNDCNDVETETLAMIPHDFVGTVTKEPTCTETGVMSYDCRDCDAVTTASIDTVPHSYEKITATKAMQSTITSVLKDVLFGYEGDTVFYYRCSDCTKLCTVSEKPFTGTGVQSSVCRHVLGEWKEYIAPTCGSYGIDARFCIKCEEPVEIRISASGSGNHQYSTAVTPPTCTDRGYTTYTCACGDSYVGNYVEKLDHTFTDYRSNGDATCTKDGTKTAVCGRGCGTKDTVTDTGSKTGHSYQSSVTPPTCTERGYTTYTCVCGDSYVGNYVNKLNHKFTDYRSNGDATCTKDGTKTAVCDRGCGTKDTVTDTGSKKSHSFTQYRSDGNATVDKDGTKTATCDRGCGAKDTVTDVGSKLPPSDIASDYYEVSGGFVQNIGANTSVGSFLNQLKDNSSLRVLKDGKVQTGVTVLGTGMVVQLMNGNQVVKSATVVVTGDTNGDGKITITDMLALKAHLLKKSTLSGASGKAGDTNADKGISITDFLQLKAHILGKSQVGGKPAKVSVSYNGAAHPSPARAGERVSAVTESLRAISLSPVKAPVPKPCFVVLVPCHLKFVCY